MSRAWLLLLCSACGFRVNGSEPLATEAGVDAVVSDGPDADMSDAPDAAIDAALPTFACNASDPNLRLCFPFDGNSSEDSSSSYSISSNGVTFNATGYSGQAAAFTNGDTFTIGANNALNVSQLSIRMRIFPTQLPSVRAGLLDSGGRYRLFLQAGGQVRCALTGGADLTTNTLTPIVANQWTQVVCTYDGTTMRLYFNGTMVGSLTQGGSIPSLSGGAVIGHNNPTGENFIGSIDEVELWNAIKPP